MPILDSGWPRFRSASWVSQSDNGSESIKGHMAALLGMRLIECTKSRARQTTDNALAKSTNGAVGRKLFGQAHRPQRWAPLINACNQEHRTPYLTLHRPCCFREIRTDQKGKEHKGSRYERMMTPDDKLKSLPRAKKYCTTRSRLKYLRAGPIRSAILQAADRLQKVRQHVVTTIHGQTDSTG